MIAVALATVGVVAAGAALLLVGDGDGRTETGVEVSIGELGPGSISTVGSDWIGANHVAWSARRGDARRLVPTPLEAVPRGSSIELSVPLEFCSGEDTAIDRVDLLKGSEGIVLTVYVGYDAPYGPGATVGCTEELIFLTETVDIGEPVGDRPIYDGVRWPPVQRWPER